MESQAGYIIEQSSEGAPTLAFVDNGGRKIYLHSRIRPSLEAESLRDRFKPESFDTLVVLGAGLGYHLAPLRDLHARYSRILVIDIFAGLEGEIAKLPASEFLLHCENLDFITGKNAAELGDILSEALNIDSMKGIQVLEHPASVRAFSEYYAAVKAAVSAILERQAGNLATRRAFAMRYLRNGLINLRGLSGFRPVAPLFGALAGHPAVVVTSGPSLDGLQDALSHYRERLFIIAVDSALAALARRSIAPDFLVSIDPQPFIYEHFAVGVPKDTLPVYTLTSHPFPAERFPGLLSLNSHPLSQLLDELRPGAFGSVDSKTGTVTGDALCLAHALGCNPIGLAGSDFCFRRFSIYARGTAYQHRYARFFQSRVNPVETQNLRYIMKSSRSFRHHGAFSRRSFIQYKESLERLVARQEMKALINLSSGGIVMEGVPNLGSDEFFSRYCRATLPKSELKRSILSPSPMPDFAFSGGTVLDALRDGRVRARVLEASLGKIHDAGFDRAEEKMLSFLSR
jgi:hypothetical protein